MGHKFKRNIHLFILLIFQLYFFLFFGIAANKADDSEGRIDQVILLFLVVIFFYFSFKNIYANHIVNNLRNLNIKFILFVGLWMFSALLYLNTGNINRVLSYLPTIMFVMLSFGYFLHLSSKNYINDNTLKLFTSLVFVIVSYNFYLTLTNKMNLLGEDNFYKHSNNAGYGFVMIIPLLIYTFKRNILLRNFLLGIAYICVLFSSKRGAILIATLLLLLYSYNIIVKQKSIFKRIIAILLVTIVSFSLFIILSDNLDSILYRFSASGGSGRDVMYIAILDNFLSGDIFELIFGHGFFSTSEATREAIGIGQMAHNDFLEIIHDIGLIGIIIFLVLYFSFIKNYLVIKKINKEDAFIIKLCLLLWIMKMTISGVIVSKVSIFIFITLGLVMGKYNLKAKK